MQVHHIGYLVKKMDKAIENFQNMGYHIKDEMMYDSTRDIDICFLEMNGYVIELVSPCSKESVVYDQLKRQGVGPYHICYEVENLEESIDKLREQRYVLTQEPMKAPAISDRRVAFMYNNSIGLIELVEN